MLGHRLACSPLLLGGLVGMLLGVAVLSHSRSAAALVGSEFVASRISDDPIFFNYNALDTSTIQRFLNAKVPVCDTWGTKLYAGTTRAAYAASKGVSTPFTCLKDYRQDVPSKSPEAYLCTGLSGGNKTAAQIIFEVGQSCGVSPAVLVVLLEKEQNLVSDDWPWPIQYRSATGYGCPDTAPCDAEYYGFFNQVYAAARQFKKYALNPNYYNFAAGRPSFVGYHPNSGCGGGVLTLQNNATAGLYNYTPYQPNRAALDNLYGSGDSCSAYGNRNFWRMYNDWFGSSLTGWKPSPVYKGITGTQLYMVWGGSKYYIPSYDVMVAWHLHQSPVNVVADSYLDGLPSGDWLSSIVKASDNPASPLFLLDDGKRYEIPFQACKYDLQGQPNPNTSWGIDCFNTNVSKAFPSDVIERYTVPDISLPLMIAYNNAVWKLEDGKRRRIVDPLVIDVLGGWGHVRWMKDSNAAQPIGKMIMGNGFVVRFSDSPVVYLFDNDQLNVVPTPDSLVNWKLYTKIHDFPAAFNTDPLPVVDGSLKQIATDGQTYYLVDKGYKMSISSGVHWPVTGATKAPTSLQSLPTIPLSDVYLSEGNRQIFTVYNHHRYVFATMDDFYRLGFSPAYIRQLSGFVDDLPGLDYGGMHLANHRLYKINNNLNQIYMVNGSTSLRVNAINYAGLEYDKLITVDPVTAARYPVAGTYSP